MNLMATLAKRQMGQNRRRTWITLIGIWLSVAMITAVSGFVFSARLMLRDMYIANNGDWHIAIYNITKEQARGMAQDARVQSSFEREFEAEGTGLGLCMRLKEPTRAYRDTAQAIAQQYGVIDAKFMDNKELLAIEGIFATDGMMMTFATLGALLIGVIMVGSVLVISNAFAISTSERMRQFGMLKSVGATREQIRATVLFEGFWLALLGIPGGIALGYGIEAVALYIANALLGELMAVSQLKDSALQMRIVFAVLPVLIAAALSLVTILLSAWLPARRCSRISAIDAIRMSGEIKLSEKKMRTSRSVQRLFGIEGALAAKALKRSRRKYRATVLSLVVGIVLFLVSNSFGVLMGKSAEMVYGEELGNVRFMSQSADIDMEMGERITEALREIPDVTVGSARIANLVTDNCAARLSPQSAKIMDGVGWVQDAKQETSVQLMTVDAESFVAVCKDAGVAPEALRQGGELRGILVNTAVFQRDGKRIELQPFASARWTLPLFSQGEKLATLALVGEVRELPPAVQLGARASAVCAVVSREAYAEIVAGSIDERMDWIADAKDARAFCDAGGAVFTQLVPNADASYSNYAEAASIQKNMYRLIMVFVYGFIVLLSLIGVTSVIGTISTSVALRAQEFAMLSSVGMTAQGLRRMLRLESLFYGGKALMIGVPLGLGLAYLMNRAVQSTLEFPFQWPWQGIGFCVVAVLLITFCTMRFSARKLQNSSIVDTLKNANL